MSHCTLKRPAMLVAAVGGAVLLAAAAQAAEYKWRMTTPVAENSYPYVEFIKRFVDETKTLTDNQVQITPYGAGVIAPAFKAYDAVLDGLVETALTSPTYLTNKDPVNARSEERRGGKEC